VESAYGERFARALGTKDAAAMLDLLAPDIDFAALTPGRSWENSSAADLVENVMFGRWFEPTDSIEAIESIEHGVVGDRPRVGYRFRVTNPDGAFLVEQQAYFDVRDDRIAWLRIVCSGFRPVTPMT
jgi:hypothetical protein